VVVVVVVLVRLSLLAPQQVVVEVEEAEITPTLNSCLRPLY